MTTLLTTDDDVGIHRPGSLAEALQALGDVSPARVRMRPAPGLATEEDAVRINEAGDSPLCELVDGVLIEKPMGFQESWLACWLITYINNHLMVHPIGAVIGADGMIRFGSGIRIPDVSYFRFDRFPDGKLTRDAVTRAIPDLAVEVLSPSNTWGEMARKRHEYFAAGCQMVWMVEPKLRQVDVYINETDYQRLTENDVLDGGDVLPGLTIPLKDLFSRPDRVWSVIVRD